MTFYIFENNLEAEMICRMLIACICGIAVGFERTKHQKAAGVRTYLIVAVGATIFTMVSKYGFLEMVGDGQRVDVARVASNIVTGVGFLGAGTIFLRGNRITGLTTSAGIWAMAAIGMAFGNGMYIIAIVATVLIIFVQITLQHQRFAHLNVRTSGRITVSMDDKMKTLETLEAVLQEEKIEIETTHIKRNKENNVTYTFGVLMPEDIDVSAVVSKIARIRSVRSIDM